MTSDTGQYARAMCLVRIDTGHSPKFSVSILAFAYVLMLYFAL
eukprot:COSAG04_NODE_3818_length_2498_cov_1.546895_2_plen_43_part_00